jgi:hypothetical protein
MHAVCTEVAGLLAGSPVENRFPNDAEKRARFAVELIKGCTTELFPTLQRLGAAILLERLGRHAEARDIVPGTGKFLRGSKLEALHLRLLSSMGANASAD